MRVPGVTAGAGKPGVTTAGTALVLSACVAYWTVTGDQTARVATHLVVFGAAFGAYLLGLFAVDALSVRGVWMALVLALVWRLALVTAPPLISDDVFRYVWEGRVQLHGGNPYAWSDRPEAEKWSSLRDPIWARVTHKHYTAVYPAFWQLVARGVVTLLGDSVAAMKLFLVLCEALTCAALALTLKRRDLPPGRLLVLAWSPLALVEIAGSGHNEAAGLLLLTGALVALEIGRPTAAAVAGALAFQVKLLPALVLLAWARRFRLVHVVTGLGVAVACVWPFRGAGFGLVRSLEKYGAFWLFNETLFAPLASLLGHAYAVRLVAVAAFALAALLAWRRVEPVAAALLTLSAWLLLGPSILPWYALWLLPFLVLRDVPPLLLFTGTIQLAYLVYPGWLSGAPWQVDWRLRALEYVPCVCVGIAWWWRHRRSNSRPAASA